MTYEPWATASDEDQKGHLEDPCLSVSREAAIDNASDNGGSMLLELWTVTSDDPIALACFVANTLCAGTSKVFTDHVKTKRYRHRVGGPAW